MEVFLCAVFVVVVVVVVSNFFVVFLFVCLFFWGGGLCVFSSGFCFLLLTFPIFKQYLKKSIFIFTGNKNVTSILFIHQAYQNYKVQ